MSTDDARYDKERKLVCYQNLLAEFLVNVCKLQTKPVPDFDKWFTDYQIRVLDAMAYWETGEGNVDKESNQ